MRWTHSACRTLRSFRDRTVEDPSLATTCPSLQPCWEPERCLLGDWDPLEAAPCSPGGLAQKAIATRDGDESNREPRKLGKVTQTGAGLLLFPCPGLGGGWAGLGFLWVRGCL